MAKGESIALVAAVLGGAIVYVPFYVLGKLVSILGSILRAILDGTVTGSPFLTKEQMKKLLSQ